MAGDADGRSDESTTTVCLPVFFFFSIISWCGIETLDG